MWRLPKATQTPFKWVVRSCYHEDNPQHSEPAPKVRSRPPLKLGPAVRCELECYALYLPPRR